MAAALSKRLELCTERVIDAEREIFHRISRQLDARDDLWDSFARHLGLDEEFIAETTCSLMEEVLQANALCSPCLIFDQTWK